MDVRQLAQLIRRPPRTCRVAHTCFRPTRWVEGPVPTHIVVEINQREAIVPTRPRRCRRRVGPLHQDSHHASPKQ